MEEVWKDIEGYEGLYQVSNLGRVKSFDFDAWHKGRILKHGITNGYCYVSLCKNKERKMFRVHRLVAIAFIPNPNNLPCVNHKDCNKLNNNVENLEWCTYSENMKHAFLNGLYKQERAVECLLNGIVIKRYRSAREAEKDGFSNQLIAHCCRGRRKHHKGYEWRYAKKQFMANEHCIYERTDDGCRWCELGICSCAGCKERILSNNIND